MVEILNTNLKNNELKLIEFLSNNDLEYDYDVDLCLVIKNKDKIVASACRKNNIFKMIAVDKEYQSLDYVAKLVSELIFISHKENLYHYFIFTKSMYFSHFINLNFKLLVEFENVGLLEYGTIKFENYYQQYEMDKNKNNGVIVMNCNPFTLGHRYLIESSAKLVDNLIVFIVEENKSLFNFSDRIFLVKEGCKDLKNVKVIPSGPYIISSATFPTYFLKSIDAKTYYYTNIDLLLFKKIMKQMNLSIRFFGEEPNDELTNLYLQQAKKVLDNNIYIFERIKVDNKIISASLVRKYLDEKNYDKIKPLVNDITYNFIINKFKKE